MDYIIVIIIIIIIIIQNTLSVFLNRADSQTPIN